MPKVKAAAASPVVAKTKNPAKEPNKAPKSKPMPGGVSVHAELPTREPKWNARRTGLIKAMRALGATDATTGRTALEIGKKMGTVDGIDMVERVDYVKICLDVYRPAELVHNGFVKSIRQEGDRELRYYLTAKGQKTDFPEVVTERKPRAKKEDAETLAPKVKVKTKKKAEAA